MTEITMFNGLRERLRRKYFDSETEGLAEEILENSASWQKDKIEIGFRKKNPNRVASALQTRYRMLVDAIAALESQVNSSVDELNTFRSNVVNDVLERADAFLESHEYKLPQKAVNELIEDDHLYSAKYNIKYPKKLKPQKVRSRLNFHMHKFASSSSSGKGNPGVALAQYHHEKKRALSRLNEFVPEIDLFQKEVVGVAITYREILRNLGLILGLHKRKARALSNELVSPKTDSSALNKFPF